MSHILCLNTANVSCPSCLMSCVSGSRPCLPLGVRPACTFLPSSACARGHATHRQLAGVLAPNITGSLEIVVHCDPTGAPGVATPRNATLITHGTEVRAVAAAAVQIEEAWAVIVFAPSHAYSRTRAGKVSNPSLTTTRSMLAALAGRAICPLPTRVLLQVRLHPCAHARMDARSPIGKLTVPFDAGAIIGKHTIRCWMASSLLRVLKMRAGGRSLWESRARGVAASDSASDGLFATGVLARVGVTNAAIRMNQGVNPLHEQQRQGRHQHQDANPLHTQQRPGRHQERRLQFQWVRWPTTLRCRRMEASLSGCSTCSGHSRAWATWPRPQRYCVAVLCRHSAIRGWVFGATPCLRVLWWCWGVQQTADQTSRLWLDSPGGSSDAILRVGAHHHGRTRGSSSPHHVCTTSRGWCWCLPHDAFPQGFLRSNTRRWAGGRGVRSDGLLESLSCPQSHAEK